MSISDEYERYIIHTKTLIMSTISHSGILGATARVRVPKDQNTDWEYVATQNAIQCYRSTYNNYDEPLFIILLDYYVEYLDAS